MIKDHLIFDINIIYQLKIAKYLFFIFFLNWIAITFKFENKKNDVFKKTIRLMYKAHSAIWNYKNSRGIPLMIQNELRNRGRFYIQ